MLDLSFMLIIYVFWEYNMFVLALICCFFPQRHGDGIWSRSRDKFRVTYS